MTGKHIVISTRGRNPKSATQDFSPDKSGFEMTGKHFVISTNGRNLKRIPRFLVVLPSSPK